jgi:YD repeat-containing protein
MIDPTGVISTVAGNGSAGFGGDGGPAAEAVLNNPQALFIDQYGNLYIADATKYRIRKVDTSGTISTVWQYTQSTDYVSDLVVDPMGNLYVAQPEENQAKKVLPDGTVQNIAGTGDFSYGADIGDGGPALNALLNSPRAIAFDPAGHLLIGQNQRVRRCSEPLPYIAYQGVYDTVYTDSNGLGYVISGQGLHTKTVDADNRLSQIILPTGNAYSFEYTLDGLMTSEIDPAGNRFEHEFDPNGRATHVTDEEGGN